MTLRAIRLSTPIKLDGQLDEAAYATTPPFTDFFQMEPVEGDVATEKTEVWIFFDNDNVYVTFRVLGEPARRARRQRDAARQQQHLPERSHRVPVRHLLRPAQRPSSSTINPIGGPMGRADHQRAAVQRATGIPIWDLAVGRFDGGWTVEVAIPVQVASLSARARADLGLQRAARQSRRRTRPRSSPSCRASLGQRALLPVVAGRHARRPRSAAGVAEPRDQAVR